MESKYIANNQQYNIPHVQYYMVLHYDIWFIHYCFIVSYTSITQYCTSSWAPYVLDTFVERNYAVK